MIYFAPKHSNTQPDVFPRGQGRSSLLSAPVANSITVGVAEEGKAAPIAYDPMWWEQFNREINALPPEVLEGISPTPDHEAIFREERRRQNNPKRAAKQKRLARLLHDLTTLGLAEELTLPKRKQCRCGRAK